MEKGISKKQNSKVNRCSYITTFEKADIKPKLVIKERSEDITILSMHNKY